MGDGRGIFDILSPLKEVRFLDTGVAATGPCGLHRLIATLPSGNALPKYIRCGKLVTVVASTALRTCPMTVTEG